MDSVRSGSVKTNLPTGNSRKLYPIFFQFGKKPTSQPAFLGKYTPFFFRILPNQLFNHDFHGWIRFGLDRSKPTSNWRFQKTISHFFSVWRICRSISRSPLKLFWFRNLFKPTSQPVFSDGAICFLFWIRIYKVCTPPLGQIGLTGLRVNGPQGHRASGSLDLGVTGTLDNRPLGFKGLEVTGLGSSPSGLVVMRPCCHGALGSQGYGVTGYLSTSLAPCSLYNFQ